MGVLFLLGWTWFKNVVAPTTQNDPEISQPIRSPRVKNVKFFTKRFSASERKRCLHSPYRLIQSRTTNPSPPQPFTTPKPELILPLSSWPKPSPEKPAAKLITPFAVWWIAPLSRPHTRPTLTSAGWMTSWIKRPRQPLTALPFSNGSRPLLAGATQGKSRTICAVRSR